MDETRTPNPSHEEVNRLRALLAQRDALIGTYTRQLAQRDQAIVGHRNTITQHEAAITTLTQQRDEYYLEKLRLEVRLAQALKQAYGPRADRIGDPGQLLLGFGDRLEAMPASVNDLPVESNEDIAEPQRASRRLPTRGRRDIGRLDHLPMIERTYELTDELCACPTCRHRREKIGTAISYTIEYLPGGFIRIKHIQHKYACRGCEQNGHNPNIEQAEKTQGSPIDKGLPGPGLLAYVATSKFGDYLPLHRLQHIFARQGFELDRSTMCLWMADVARLVRPLYDLMVRRVLASHVLATDDTVMPLWQPGKTKQARMWIYQGDASQPYNVFDFTESRRRDGPLTFLKDFGGTLLADAYGGYDGIVLAKELPRAGCWSHARRKFVDSEKAAPEAAQAILQRINGLFALEKRFKDLEADERLRRRRAEAGPRLDALHAMLTAQKMKLLPKHPLAEAIGYTLNQWRELTLFTTDPAVPIHNNLAEQQMKRIALLRKNALFAGSPRGGRTAAILTSLTSTCRRHEINPQAYLTQLLAHLPDTPMSELEMWLPDRWKKTSTDSPAEPSRASN
jgi:transposase